MILKNLAHSIKEDVMKKYKFSEAEQSMLKVAKHNQENSNKLLIEAKQLKTRMTASNDDNEQFLTALENKLGITPQVSEYKSSIIIRETPVIPDWEQLVSEANANINYNVDYEDLLTSE